MNIAQTASETTAVTSVTTIYINMEFSKLADDINGNTLVHQFNGKGRKIALIPEEQESKYLNYSSDKEGKEILTPPFEINNGDNIKFKLQTASTDNGDVSFKWKGIIQNQYDLQLVAGKKSTYNANISDVATSEDDEVTINVNFKSNGDKFSVVWDPKVRIGRG